MTLLTVDQVMKLHATMLQATGGAEGLRDKGALESSLYHAFASFDGQDLYPSLEEKAARKAYSIIRSHPFVDGNKRTGLFVMLIFLEINGIVLKSAQDELVELGNGLASGNMDDKEVLQWIRSHKDE